MDSLEEKMSAILGNPELMQQIMTMAQSLGESTPPPPQKEEPKPQTQPSMPDIDPAMIGKIMSLAGKTNIDRNQKALLCALEPYLTKGRLQKLEKAMHAAKIAGAASAFFPNGTIPFLSGR